MFRRVLFAMSKIQFCEKSGQHTLSSVTKSAACSKVKPEMSSTILLMMGSLEVAEGAVCEGSAAAVAKHLEWVGSRDQLLRSQFTSSEPRERRPG